MSPDNIFHKKLNNQIEQIDELIEEYEELLNKCKKQKPDKVEIAALGSVLHSFYNGLENIFKIIAQEIDKDLPQGHDWHKRLLKQMSENTLNRKAIITEDIIESVQDYLAFRHFFRHSYTYLFEWKKMNTLVTSLQDIWLHIKNRLKTINKRTD